MVLPEFWGVGPAILNGLLNRLQRHVEVLRQLLRRPRLLFIHELAVQRPRPDAFPFDAQLLVARPRPALEILPLARCFGHGICPPSDSMLSVVPRHHNAADRNAPSRAV